MNFDYTVDAEDAGDKESSEANLPSRNIKDITTVKASRKKKIGHVQSSTADVEEAEIPEVTSPVNEKGLGNEDEDDSDEDERTDTSLHNREHVDDEDVGERVVTGSQGDDRMADPEHSSFPCQGHEDVDHQS